jgi:cellulose biosynthesis protein BcsQ
MDSQIVAPTNLKVVMALSRKGGVGKTSILLSAAIQLAAAGKKVAIVDLDTQGTHLSQFLPTDRDFVAIGSDNAIDYQFAQGAFRNHDNREMPVYGDRPNLAWLFPRSRRKGTRPTVMELMGRIVVPAELSRAFVEHRGGAQSSDPLNKVINNLGVWLCSCYLRDLDTINNSIVTKEGQETFRNVLTEIAETVAKNGFEYLLIDNSPGLSFTGANGLAWAFEWSLNHPPSPGVPTVHPWLVGLANWWEQGLMLYEANVYAQQFVHLSPTLVINRVYQPWLGEPEFGPGCYVPLRGEARPALLAKMARKLFTVPIWIAGDYTGAASQGGFSILNKFIPESYSVAVLRDDMGVRNSMLRSVEEGRRDQSAGAATEAGSEETAWDLAKKFFRSFLFPALWAAGEMASSQSSGGPFHSDVRKLLIGSKLLESGPSGPDPRSSSRS